MSHCGSPGMCGGRSDCPDTHCPGRGLADEALYAPLRASELEGQACECALPSIVDDPKPTGWNWQAIAYFAIVALVLIWTALMITR